MTEYKYACMVLLTIATTLGVTSYITSNLAFLLVGLGFTIIGAIFGTMYYWYWNNTISKMYITTAFICAIIISLISFTADYKYKSYKVQDYYISENACDNVSPVITKGGTIPC